MLTRFFGWSRGTYFSWKKEGRPVIKFVLKYLTEKDIEEFIETGKISRFEKLLINSDEDELLEKHIAYELRHKLYLDTASSFGNWLGHVVGMPVIHKALEEIARSNYTKSDTKEKILNQIKGMELSGLFNKIFEKANKNVASRYIDRNLSELECYVWVKHNDIVTSYNKYWS